jgi:Domain of unknown function (DUF1841)
MFNPTQAEVRRFFCDAWAKHRAQQVLTPLETLAVDWVQLHPEYHDDFSDGEKAIERQYDLDTGRTNPFLHLSMHLSITEQVSIDQPKGIRQAVEQLVRKRGNVHDAHHEVMEALGQMLWAAQRSGQPPDGQAYVADVMVRAGR